MIVDDSFDWRLNLRNDLIRDSPDSLININWIACRNLRAPCGGMVHNNDLERLFGLVLSGLELLLMLLAHT